MTTKITEIQGIIGVDQDGIWGSKSQAALDAILHPPPPAGSTGTAYSKTFTNFMPWIFQWEGTAYEDDPNDPGGATKYGIDQRSHPGISIRNLTESQAMDIYWDEWVKDGCLNFTSPYAEVFFNCAVNMGLGRAKEFDAISNGDPKTFLALQEAKYRSIAANNHSMQEYLKGWLNRTSDLRQRFVI